MVARPRPKSSASRARATARVCVWSPSLPHPPSPHPPSLILRRLIHIPPEPILSSFPSPHTLLLQIVPEPTLHPLPTLDIFSSMNLTFSGMSYIVSRPALSMVGPFLASCLAGVVSNHSDTEMGRCMYRHAHVDCRPISPDFKIFNMFYARDGANVSPFKQVDGRLHVKLSETPLLPNFRAVFMHPIKDGPQMDRFHNQVHCLPSYLSPLPPSPLSLSRLLSPLSPTTTSSPLPPPPPCQRSSSLTAPVVQQLRPLQIFPDASHPTALDWHYKTAQQDFRASCVNNPTLQRVLHRVELPECGPVPADRIIVVGPSFPFPFSFPLIFPFSSCCSLLT